MLLLLRVRPAIPDDPAEIVQARDWIPTNNADNIINQYDYTELRQRYIRTQQCINNYIQYIKVLNELKLKLFMENFDAKEDINFIKEKIDWVIETMKLDKETIEDENYEIYKKDKDNNRFKER